MGVAMKLTIRLPPGCRVETPLTPLAGEDDGRIVRVNDRAEPGVLVLDRLMDIPVGRVQPDAYYIQLPVRLHSAAAGTDPR